MNVAKVSKNKSWKQCNFIGCTEKLYGSPWQKYCTKIECKSRRLEFRAERRKPREVDAHNLILKKSTFSTVIPHGHVLKLRCRALNCNGRCKNAFTVVYEKRREVYPMFCKEHRNAFKRKMFQMKGKVIA